MSKIIKISERTYDELAKHGTVKDTFDSVIQRLLRQTSPKESD